MDSPLNTDDCGFSAATLGGVTLLCPAWIVTNLDAVWSVVHVGEDYEAPRFDGVVAQGRSLGRLDVSLQLVFSGYHTRLGVENANPIHGLAANRRYFRSNVVALPGGTDTRTLSLTEDDGTTVTAAVHVEQWTWVPAKIRGMARAVLPISVPTGELTAP